MRRRKSEQGYVQRWHGGTNFGRWGSSYKTASYDYDAPMTEYGYPAVPKYEHLKRLHAVLNQYADLILDNVARWERIADEVVSFAVYPGSSCRSLNFIPFAL